MKILKLGLLACACAAVMTFTSIAGASLAPSSPDSPENTAVVQKVITSESGSCVIIFLSGEDEIPVSEENPEKCSSYNSGDIVSF